MRNANPRSETPAVRELAITLYRLLYEAGKPLDTETVLSALATSPRMLRFACKHLRDHGYCVATTRNNPSLYWLTDITPDTEHMVDRYAADAFSALLSYYRSTKRGYGGRERRSLRNAVSTGLRQIGVTLLRLDDEQVTPMMKPLAPIPEIEAMLD